MLLSVSEKVTPEKRLSPFCVTTSGLPLIPLMTNVYVTLLHGVELVASDCPAEDEPDVDRALRLRSCGSHR